MDQEQQNDLSNTLKRSLSPEESEEAITNNQDDANQLTPTPPQKLHTIYRCGTCKLPFMSKEKLNTHYRVVHNYVHCHTCKKTFIDRRDVQEHYNLVHKANKTYCVPCNISFKAIEDFINHCNKMHNNKNPNEGENSELAERDLSEILNNSEDPSQLQCKVCKSKYPSIAELTRHYHRAHKNVKRDTRQTLKKCSICSKTFVTAIELVLHCNKVHNLNSAEDCYVCTICCAEFGNSKSLNEHRERVHIDLISNDSKTDVMKCQMCSKQFKDIHMLADHTKKEHEK